MNKVVITGMGTINPAGNNIAEFTESLKKGKTCISEIDEFDTSDFPVKVWGKIKNYNSNDHFSKQEASRMDKFIQYAVITANEALKDCGTDFYMDDPYRCGIITGVGFGGMSSTESEISKFLKKGRKGVSATYIPSMIPNMGSGFISIKTGFKGTGYSVNSACASSSHAIGEAFRKIKDGYLDVCLCGGSEACITQYCLSGFSNMKALSLESDPTKASIPFDINRKGFVLGEGAGMLVLESEEHALKRSAKIYAEICGYGSTSDAFHITRPDPEAAAVSTAIEQALYECKIKHSQIEYINAHGTSTYFNDQTEAKAIHEAFGDKAEHIYVNSTKSITGHLLGGSGAVEACASVLQLSLGFIHPTAGYHEPDPECNLNIVKDKALEININNALSISLGFGGHNAVLCFKKYEKVK